MQEPGRDRVVTRYEDLHVSGRLGRLLPWLVVLLPVPELAASDATVSAALRARRRHQRGCRRRRQRTPHQLGHPAAGVVRQTRLYPGVVQPGLRAATDQRHRAYRRGRARPRGFQSRHPQAAAGTQQRDRQQQARTHRQPRSAADRQPDPARPSPVPGKVDPAQLDAQWHTPRTGQGLDTLLQGEDAIETGRVDALLQSLTPQSVTYRRRKQALATDLSPLPAAWRLATGAGGTGTEDRTVGPAPAGAAHKAGCHARPGRAGHGPAGLR
jgi:hypothetical protein